MTHQNNAAQAANENPRSDEYVNAIIQRHGYDSHETVIARLAQWIGLNGGEDGVTLLMYEAHKALSMLRGTVSDIREAFELSYAMDADDPASATELSHFTNGWRACIMSQVGKPVLMKLAVDATAAIDLINAEAARLRAPVADERAAFETAMQNRGQNVDRWPNPHGGYRRLSTEIAWYAWNDRAALASAPVAGEAFMYGIMGPDGKAHVEEFCVSGDRTELQTEVVDHLNRDNPEDGTYSVVALFRDAAPQGQRRGVRLRRPSGTASRVLGPHLRPRRPRGRRLRSHPKGTDRGRDERRRPEGMG